MIREHYEYAEIVFRPIPCFDSLFWISRTQGPEYILGEYSRLIGSTGVAVYYLRVAGEAGARYYPSGDYLVALNDLSREGWELGDDFPNLIDGKLHIIRRLVTKEKQVFDAA